MHEPTPTRRLPPGVTFTPANNCFQINIMWRGHEGWAVGYPVIPVYEENSPNNFVPGRVTQWDTMSLMDYLNMLADEYQLPKVFIANF